MKKLIYVISIISLLFVFSNEALAKKDKVKTISELIKESDKFINKEVTIKGKVTHVCAHSGRRCFLKDAKEKLTIRVEAKGKIKGFNRELRNENIVVTGTLKVHKLSEEKINEMSKKYKEHNHCDTESNSIKNMRAWMKKHGKNFYNIYYIEGKSYKVQ